MKRALWLVAFMFVALAIVTGGCGNPKAIPPLTEAEKAEMIEIALIHPEVARWLDKGEPYTTEVGWSAVGWHDSEATGFSQLEYEEIADGKLPTDGYFPADVTVNPHVYIRINPPTGKHLHVAFDREKMEVVAVQLMPPMERGPSPAEKSSTGGMENPRWLTADEKDEVIEIALNTPEAKEAREIYGAYNTSLRWVAIKGDVSGGLGLWGFDYEMVDNIPENIPRDVEYYSQVEIYFGEPEQLLLRVAVNPDTGEVANIEGHPLKIIPK